MPRALLVLIPVVLVAVPLVRFTAGLLMVLLVLASIGRLIVAAQTGEARDVLCQVAWDPDRGDQRGVGAARHLVARVAQLSGLA